MFVLLSPGELLLFERMARFDQRHALDVYHTLLRGGHTDPLLLRAALLHDCGKVANDGQTIPLIYYGLFVDPPALRPGALSLGRPIEPAACCGRLRSTPPMVSAARGWPRWLAARPSSSPS